MKLDAGILRKAPFGVLTSQLLFSAGSFLLTLAFARVAAPQVFASMAYLQLAASLPTSAAVSAVTLLGLHAGGSPALPSRLRPVLLMLSGGAGSVATLLFAAGAAPGLSLALLSFPVLMLYMLYVTSRRAAALTSQPGQIVVLDGVRFAVVVVICVLVARHRQPSLLTFIAAFALAHGWVLAEMVRKSSHTDLVSDRRPGSRHSDRSGEVLWQGRSLLFGLLLNSVLSQMANLAAPRLCSPAAFAALRGVEVLFLPVFTLLQAGDMAVPVWLRARAPGRDRIGMLVLVTLGLVLAPAVLGASILAVRGTSFGRIVLNPVYTGDTLLVIGLSILYALIAFSGSLQWALLVEGRAKGFVGVSLASGLIGLLALVVFRKDGALGIVAARIAYECILCLAMVLILRSGRRTMAKLAQQ